MVKPGTSWMLTLWLLAVSVVVTLQVVSVSAQSGGYDLAWFSVDSGGGQSVGGMYTLDGVIGQPDASLLSGGVYTLSGGFLKMADYKVYLPVVLR